MRKYNPKLLQYPDALVCVGGILSPLSPPSMLESREFRLVWKDMTIHDLDFEESCDDNLICSHHHDELPHKAPEKREKREQQEEGEKTYELWRVRAARGEEGGKVRRK
jgi:hypothetical protein